MLKPRDPWDEDLDILSAENVNFAVETAGLGSRFGAALIDLLLQMLILALMGWAAYFLLDLLPPMDEASKWVRAVVNGLGIILFVMVTNGYSFFFEWLWDGQTPGKRWLGLRVLQTAGTPITAWDAMVRSVLRTVDFLPLFYGAGAMIALINPHNRRIGDLVAGTVVARERHEAGSKHIMNIDAAAEAFLASCAAPAGVAANGIAASGMAANGAAPSAAEISDTALRSLDYATAQQAVPEGAASLDYDSLRLLLSEQDIELVREFFVRREKLNRQARVRLAHSLAARLCLKLRRHPPSEAEAEGWLEELARALFAATAP